eukprot:1431512-Amphidinium_carterae.1
MTRSAASDWPFSFYAVHPLNTPVLQIVELPSAWLAADLGGPLHLALFVSLTPTSDQVSSRAVFAFASLPAPL